MKRKIQAMLAWALSLILLTATLQTLWPVGAAADTQDEIEELRARREVILAMREQKQAVIDELATNAVSIMVQKRALDERNLYTMQQIALNNEEILLYEQMIAEKEKEVLHAQELEAEQLMRYRARVRAMEENGTLNYLALILKSDTLGEMLTAIDDVGEIMLRDRELEDAYIRARQNSEEVKAEYEAYRAEITGKQEELRREQEDLEREITEANELLIGLHEDYLTRQAEIAEIDAMEEETNRAISALVAKLEAARRAAEQDAGSDGGGASGASAYSTGFFIFPVASYSYISSRFGERIHPITGELKNHNGMDIAANMGTAVFAADGGTVVLAEWYGGYGNCIMIDHGNGYKTLYGHLSYIGVRSGQSVNQGDNIGQVGSTGNSTGPHLHFEVYSSGNRIDPEQFYSGLVISADAGV